MEALVKFAAQLSSDDNDAVVDEGYNGNKNNNDNDDIINNTLSSFGLIANNNNNNNNNSLNNKKINNVNNNNNNNNNNSNNSSNCNGNNKANNINSTICSSVIKKKKRVQYKHKRKNMSSPSTASSVLPPKKKKISGHALSGLTVPRKWHQWEDDALVTAVKRYSCKSWKLIANHVPNRNHVQCLQRWKKVLKPGLKKGTWDKTEDQLLIRVYHEEVARQKQRKKLFLKLKAENDKIQIKAEETRQKEREQRRFLQLKEQQEKYGNVNVNVNATTTTTSIFSATNADGTISTTNTANEVDKISATGSSDLKLTGEKDTLVSSTTTNLINNDAIVEFNENNIKEGMIKEGIVYKFTMDDVGGNIINWPSIASKIKGRTTKQCRERWYNHLDPTIKRGNWSYEEDTFLINEQARLGNKWSKISSMLEGRTENAVKIRWKSLTRVSKHNKHANKTIFDYTKKRTGQKKASSSKSRASLDMLVGNPSASHYSNLPMPSVIQTGQIPNLFYNVPVLTLQQQELARQRHQVVQQQQQQQLLLQNQMQQQQQLLLHSQMQKLWQQQQQQLLALHLLQQQQQHAQDTSSATSSTITSSSSSSSSSSNDNNDNNNNTSNNNSGIANLNALISSNNNCLLNPTPRPEGTIAPPIVPLLTAAIGGISNMENQSAVSPLTGIGRNNNNNNNNYY